jgi:hypothetical protein
MDENFIDKLLITSINHMKTNSWEWPDTWDDTRKHRFLQQCLQYAEKNEFYEQCAIIRDVEKTIGK